MSEPRQASLRRLRQFDVRPNRELGQNFLIDDNLLRVIERAAERVPDELLLVETDAPFLAPQEYRGKQNEPAFVRATAAYLAELRGQTYEQLAGVVRSNAEWIFHW